MSVDTDNFVTIAFSTVEMSVTGPSTEQLFPQANVFESETYRLGF